MKDEWDSFPAVDNLGALGDEVLAAQAVQTPKTAAIDNLGRLGDEALAAQAVNQA